MGQGRTDEARNAYSEALMTAAGGQGQVNMRMVEQKLQSLNPVPARTLEQPVADTLEAVTGEEGVVLAREHLPALVLMDILLPGIDGIEAFDQLAADPATKDIPVIAVTASAMQEERARIETVGFAGYQPKPIQLKEFMAALEDVLSRGAHT